MNNELLYMLGGAIGGIGLSYVCLRQYFKPKSSQTQYWDIIREQLLSDKFYSVPTTPQEVTNLQMSVTALVNILRQNGIAWSIVSQYVLATLRSEKQQQDNKEQGEPRLPIPMRKPTMYGSSNGMENICKLD